MLGTGEWRFLRKWIEEKDRKSDDYEQKKLQRIEDNVRLSFLGDERLRLDILTAELRYLERHGVSIPYQGTLYSEDLSLPGLIEITIAVGKRQTDF